MPALAIFVPSSLALGVPETLVFLAAPLSLAVGAIEVVLLVRALRKRPSSSKWPRIARLLLLAVVLLGFMLAMGSWFPRRNVQHLEWSVLWPATAVVLSSGLFLVADWNHDDAGAHGVRASSRLPLRLVASWFALLFGLTLLPLVFTELAPMQPTSRFSRDATAHDLVELFAWSFGGSRPHVLTPVTHEEMGRGLAFLPRNVTVAASSLWFASWSVLVFVGSALLVRGIRSPRARRVVGLVAPVSAGLAVLATVADTEPIWLAEPRALRSFGFVVASALIAMVGLAAVLVVDAIARRKLGARGDRADVAPRSRPGRSPRVA